MWKCDQIRLFCSLHNFTVISFSSHLWWHHYAGGFASNHQCLSLLFIWSWRENVAGMLLQHCFRNSQPGLMGGTEVHAAVWFCFCYFLFSGSCIWVISRSKGENMLTTTHLNKGTKLLKTWKWLKALKLKRNVLFTELNFLVWRARQ